MHLTLHNINQNYIKTHIVLLRHGRSQANLQKTWSGWEDSPLIPQGQLQAIKAAQLLKNKNIYFDVIYCSQLHRSWKTAQLIRQKMNLNISINRRWELNEKCYGSLTGMKKQQVKLQFGSLAVKNWRRSYKISPPKLFEDDFRHPLNNKLFDIVPRDQLPTSQNLTDLRVRVQKIWETQIKTLVGTSNLLMVVHGNVMRVLGNILCNLSEQQTAAFIAPNAVPLVLRVNKGTIQKKWQLLGDAGKDQLEQ